eukprot:3919360-Pleurochrysis_carterae.AAC.1
MLRLRRWRLQNVRALQTEGGAPLGELQQLVAEGESLGLRAAPAKSKGGASGKGKGGAVAKRSGVGSVEWAEESNGAVSARRCQNAATRSRPGSRQEIRGDDDAGG